jgi:hypothetical protein
MGESNFLAAMASKLRDNIVWKKFPEKFLADLNRDVSAV